MNIRLEYSPVTGKFNQAKANDQPDIAAGFKTVCCFISIDRAERFIQSVALKYPQLAGRIAAIFPTVQEMKDQILLFIDEDIQLLEQHMATTFQRRSHLLNNSK